MNKNSCLGSICYSHEPPMYNSVVSVACLHTFSIHTLHLHTSVHKSATFLASQVTKQTFKKISTFQICKYTVRSRNIWKIRGLFLIILSLYITPTDLKSNQPRCDQGAFRVYFTKHTVFTVWELQLLHAKYLPFMGSKYLDKLHYQVFLISFQFFDDNPLQSMSAGILEPIHISFLPGDVLPSFHCSHLLLLLVCGSYCTKFCLQ